ncbi:hypothetical protein [Saliphagus infecundisoli]|uniref:Polysaccharide deacetylase n=1 Tax=Saliphagus infecundisoli TaxID=1849069 RepID=A0ABD5QAH7_9EURY|nr:hypothetical protein [Saliphagus infecundisoli]
MPELAGGQRLSYTLREYEELLESLLAEGYSFTDFSPLADGEITLRHDVDLSPETALEMARIESRLDIESTYCVLLTTPVYNLLAVAEHEALREIEALGHDVALHFNTHHYWDERPPSAEFERRVRAEREVLDRLIEESGVVSFHRPPEWVLGEPFAGFENAYDPRYFTEVGYCSDSSQKWRREPPFPDGRPDRFQLLVHPGLWGATERTFGEIVGGVEAERAERVGRYLAALDP